MFSRVFSIVMIPSVVLAGLASTIIYFYVGIDTAADGDTLAAVFWFVIWGHILSMLGGAIIVGIPLAVLAALAGAAAWLVALAWRMQQRGIENLPFRVSRKVAAQDQDAEREAEETP